jgi:hypothetical protein
MRVLVAAFTLAVVPVTGSAAADRIAVTCSIEYPTYAGGWTTATGDCVVSGDLPRPAVLTVETYVGPGCAVYSTAAGWLIGADFNIGLSWTRFGTVAAVTMTEPAGAGHATFTPGHQPGICGLSRGPVTENAVFVLTPF